MKTRTILQLFVLSAVWGMSFLLIRIAGESFPPVWVALLRTSLGCALLWIALAAGGRSLPPRRFFFWLLLVAVFNNAIPFTFFAWGERTVPSNTAAVMNATTPIWALLLSWAAGSARISAFMILGVLLGFSGVLLVVWGHGSGQAGGSSHPGFLGGAAAIALASLSYAIATVIAKAKLKGLDAIGLATAQLGLASLMLLPLAVGGPRPTAIRAASIGSVLVLGLAGSGLAYWLYYSLLEHISATHLSAVTYLLPVWGLFWGRLAHEPIGWTAYTGAAVVILGLGFLNGVRPLRVRR